MVAKASNFAAAGDGWSFLQYFISYVCFVAGSCSGGFIIHYET